MAPTAVVDRLAEQHRQGQLAIRARTIRDFTVLWPLWEGNDASFRRLVSATIPLIAMRRQASAAYAARYYEEARAAANVPGAITPVLAGAVDEKQIEASLYVTGRVMTQNALAAGQTPEVAMRTALVRTSGAVGRHALNGGRETILRSVARDPRSGRWYRIASPSACDFCRMLADRGAVYYEDSADFQAHDHCGCSAAPAF